MDIISLDIEHEHCATNYQNYIASPCKKHPDTGLECQYARQDKEQEPCLHLCSVRHGRPNTQDYYDFVNGKFKTKLQEDVDSGKKKYCDFPDCDVVIGIKYRCCEYHSNLINSRYFKYKRNNGGAEPPHEWLWRPVKKHWSRQKRRQLA